MTLVTNALRARWAEIALRRFRTETGSDADDAITDLVANLGHYCDRHGIDYPEAFGRGLRHWLEERGESYDPGDYEPTVVILGEGGAS